MNGAFYKIKKGSSAAVFTFVTLCILPSFIEIWKVIDSSFLTSEIGVTSFGRQANKV